MKSLHQYLKTNGREDTIAFAGTVASANIQRMLRTPLLPGLYIVHPGRWDGDSAEALKAIEATRDGETVRLVITRHDDWTGSAGLWLGAAAEHGFWIAYYPAADAVKTLWDFLARYQDPKGGA